MDLETLKELTLPIVVIGCLIIGYIIKSYDRIDSKHIPLIMSISGIVINLFINGWFDFTSSVISPALSGLISTGLHQLFTQYIHKNEEEKPYNDYTVQGED